MIKRLSKHGNSLAILLDKPILELLNVNENTQFKIKIEEGKIILEPIHKESKISIISENEKLQKAYEDIIKKYDEALRKLAKS